MTPFDVDWSDAALDMLADIWTQAANRVALNAASDQIDRLLARDPIGKGKHLGEGLYKLAVPPLTAYYSVDHARKTVEVSDVRYAP